MFLLGIVVLLVVAYLFYLSSKSKGENPSSAQTQYANKAPSLAESFLPPIPKEYQIYVSNMNVAGITFRKDDVSRFFKATNQSLDLERETNNQYDKNAIKVIGVTPSGKCFLGYVPKEVSEQILETNSWDNIRPRLARIYQEPNGYQEIQFQIIGLKSAKKVFDSFLENQPASASQKNYYKYFGMPVPKGLTSGESEKTIDEHRNKLRAEDPSKLEEYDAYESIIDEFDDSDFRETYDVKKVSKTILNDALNQLKQEGKTLSYLSDNIQEVVDKVIHLKPELERDIT